MSLRSPICPSSHKEKKMSDAELDEGTPITLEDAAYVARDGIILLECVNGIDDARAGRGELTVHTDTGSFNLRVDLPTAQSPATTPNPSGSTMTMRDRKSTRLNSSH